MNNIQVLQDIASVLTKEREVTEVAAEPETMWLLLCGVYPVRVLIEDAQEWLEGAPKPGCRKAEGFSPVESEQLILTMLEEVLAPEAKGKNPGSVLHTKFILPVIQRTHEKPFYTEEFDVLGCRKMLREATGDEKIIWSILLTSFLREGNPPAKHTLGILKALT